MDSIKRVVGALSLSLLLTSCGGGSTPYSYGFDGGVYFGERYQAETGETSIEEPIASSYCSEVAEKGAAENSWTDAETSESRISCSEGLESVGIKILEVPSPFDLGKQAGAYAAERWIADYGSSSPSPDFVAEYCGGIAFDATADYSWGTTEMDAVALACIDEFISQTG